MILNTQQDLYLFFRKVTLLLFGLFLLSIAVVSFGDFFAMEDKNNYLLAQIDKETYLQKQISPKIILIGGSNLAFGIDSGKISQEFNMPVINMGLHANLGLRYMVTVVRESILAGDIVVVVPEYQQFFGDIFYGAESLAELVSFKSYKDFWHLSFKQKIVVLKYIPSITVKRIFLSFGQKVLNLPETNYSRDGFNEMGDYVFHLDKPQAKNIVSYDVTDSINIQSVKFLSVYSDEILKRGAKLYVVYPSFSRSSYDKSEDKIIELHVFLKQKLPESVLLSIPEDYVFDDSLFFDTSYHLNKEGRIIRTSKFIETLEKVISDRKE